MTFLNVCMGTRTLFLFLTCFDSFSTTTGIFEPVVQPALGVLMIGSALGCEFLQ
jgi:hypothetical protein